MQIKPTNITFTGSELQTVCNSALFQYKNKNKCIPSDTLCLFNTKTKDSSFRWLLNGLYLNNSTLSLDDHSKHFTAQFCHSSSRIHIHTVHLCAALAHAHVSIISITHCRHSHQGQFGVHYLAKARGMGETGIEPPSFWLEDDPLYLLRPFNSTLWQRTMPRGSHAHRQRHNCFFSASFILHTAHTSKHEVKTQHKAASSFYWCLALPPGVSVSPRVRPSPCVTVFLRQLSRCLLNLRIHQLTALTCTDWSSGAGEGVLPAPPPPNTLMGSCIAFFIKMYTSFNRTCFFLPIFTEIVTIPGLTETQT